MDRRGFMRIIAGVPFLGPLLFQIASPDKLALLREISMKIANAPIFYNASVAEVARRATVYIVK